MLFKQLQKDNIVLNYSFIYINIIYMSKKNVSFAQGTTPSQPVLNNGGIMGSGIFGMFGTMVNCDAESNSYYCNFMKIFNILMILAIIFFVLYFLYNFLKNKK